MAAAALVGVRGIGLIRSFNKNAKQNQQKSTKIL